MTYACADVVYGIDCSYDAKDGIPDVVKKVREYYNERGEDFEEVLEFGECGFETRYSAGGSWTPCFFGISLGGFDECTRVTVKPVHGRLILEVADRGYADAISLQPSEEDKERYREMLLELPEEIRPIFEKPEVFFLWSSS